jgi:hypothetical protein
LDYPESTLFPDLKGVRNVIDVNQKNAERKGEAGGEGDEK